MKKQIPILMYHDISNEPWQPNILPVAPQIFEAQLALLAKMKFHFLSLQDFFARGCRSNLHEKNVVITFDDGYKSHIQEALPILKRYNATATFFIAPGFIGNPGYMNWDEIRILKTEGMEIGSHSYSHAWLPGVKDSKELIWETHHSKEIIEAELRTPVSFFCYPLGGTNEVVSQAVAQAGYQAAVISGNCVPRVIPKEFRIPRIKIKPHDKNVRLLAKASGFYTLFSTKTKN